jgi:hypothetical protein
MFQMITSGGLRGTLGDQPTDPAFLRALVTVISGTTQDLLYAQGVTPGAQPATSLVSADDDGSPHQSPVSPWWKALDYSWALIANQIGRDDIRPLFFYAGALEWNADYAAKLIGDLKWEQDPQDLTRTRVFVTPSIVSRWLDKSGGPFGKYRSFSSAQLADLITVIQTAHRAMDAARRIDPSLSSVLRDLPAAIWRDPAFQDHVQSAFNRVYKLVTNGTAPPATVSRVFDTPAAGVLVLVQSLVGTMTRYGRIAGIGGSADADPMLMIWARGDNDPSPSPAPYPSPPPSPRAPRRSSWGTAGLLAVIAAASVGGVMVYRRSKR